MIVLSIDTTIDACQAAVLDGDTALAACSEAMTRGHQERLAPLVAETMAQAGVAFSTLDRVAVTVGPGSFTGVRVGLAFARGLALALDIPCIGVGALEALAASAGGAGKVAAAIDAKRGQVYLQLFDRGRPTAPPEALDLEVATARLGEFAEAGPVVLAGTGAALLVATIGKATTGPERPDPIVIARLGRDAAAPEAPPRPIYLRAPDARLPA